MPKQALIFPAYIALLWFAFALICFWFALPCVEHRGIASQNAPAHAVQSHFNLHCFRVLEFERDRRFHSLEFNSLSFVLLHFTLLYLTWSGITLLSFTSICLALLCFALHGGMHLSRTSESTHMIHSCGEHQILNPYSVTFIKRWCCKPRYIS